MRTKLVVLMLAACMAGGVAQAQSLPAAGAQSAPAAAAQTTPAATARVIEITADHDSRYRVNGKANPTITVKAGEPLILRITAVKAKTWNRDGSVHGFTLLRKDRSRVPGWSFLLKPGTQEFKVVAPPEPGEYIVVCTVICSDDHELMTMKFKVLP